MVVTLQLDEPLAGCSMRALRHFVRQYRKGPIEPEVCRQIRRLVSPGQVALDVGAYIGFTSLLLARQVGEDGHVFAFEPLDENLTLLTRNVESNGLGHIVTVEQMALAGREGEVVFQKPRGRVRGHGSIVQPKDSSRYHEIRIRTTSIDTYCANFLKGPNFIKVDVEGAEAEVVLGGLHILRTKRPTVLLEAHDSPNFPQNTSHQAIRLLTDLGYRMYCLEDDPELATPIQDRNWQGHKHCLALP